MTADAKQRARVQQHAGGFEPLDKTFIEATIADRFESVVRKYPKRMAVVDRQSALTFEELHNQSNCLARIISQYCGNLPEPVAILFPQGTAAINAILGVLKAGMIYVPLDCAERREWLVEVLHEVKPVMLLTDAENLALAQDVAPGGVPVIEVGAADLTVSQAKSLPVAGSADDVAYIFFTSGTTGRPKGVFDTNRNVLHNILRYTNALAINCSDRLSVLQSPAFSGTVSSLFSALLNGACLFPVNLVRENMATLGSWLRDQKITIYHSVPEIFRSIAVGDQDFPSVRVVRLEGDRASRRDLDRFRRYFPDPALIVNGLGTTETGLVCQFFMDGNTRLASEIVPVGYPSTDMNVQIVGEDGAEVSSPHIGEIAVTSRYLAAGYWQKANLTAAAFQSDSVDQEIRTYRTGDLGRIADDGSLEHLGRMDNRIRFRGNWIVLAVVEEAIEGCAGVEAAAVKLSGDMGNERLIAYVKTPNADPIDIPAIRGQLGIKLPAYAMPSRFISVRDLPVNRNGKVDRAALPVPDRGRPDISTPYVGPYSALHQQLIDLWCDLLELEQVGIKDDFFELGGDSLRAIQMLMGVHILTGRHVLPDALLERATIESLADVVLGDRDFRGVHDIFNADGDLTPFFFLHGDYISGGYYVRELARHLGPERAVVPVGPLGLAGEPVPQSYQEMAEIHLEQIRRVQPTGPYLLGGQCNGGLVALEIARLMAAQGEAVIKVAMIHASVSNLRHRWVKENPIIRSLFCIDRSLGERAFLWTRGQMEWMRAKRGQGRLRLLADRVRRRIQSRRAGQLPDRVGIEADTGYGAIAANMRRLREQYQRIDHLYIPEPYEGRIVLFWPENDANEDLTEVGRWWRQICEQTEFHQVPGNNVTCLTTHVKTLATAMAAAIDL